MTSGHPALRVRGALSRGSFAVTVLVSLAVLFTPADDVPLAPPGVDKAVHLGLFAVLALTGLWAGVRLGVLAGPLALYAGVSELVQALPPLERSGSVADLLADLAGVLLGCLSWTALSRSRRDPEPADRAG